MKYLNKLLGGLARVFIVGYQRFISPMFPPSCRFQPTCSNYALEAISRHGALRGIWLGVKRIGRCNPWGGEGFDPVPNDDDKKAKEHCCKQA